jgi:hypothetical protein
MKPALQTAVAAAASKPDDFTRTKIERLVKIRAMLQETRNRSAELQTALELFKHRQAKIGGG